MQPFNLKSLRKLYRKIGVDFGSSRLRICTDQEGVVYDQPSCIAIETHTGRVVATGQDALDMSGRLDERISVEWPVRSGVLHDASIARVLLRQALAPLLRTALLYGPEMLVSVPGSSTAAQQQALVELMYALGARQVHTIAQPLAASIGAGVPIADPSGSFLLQLGEGVVETAVVSLGSMVACERSPYAGNFLTRHIRFVLNQELGLQLSEESISKLLREVASLQAGPAGQAGAARELLITGKDAATNRPREVVITAADVQPALQFVVELVEQVIKRCLEDIPAELTVDIIDKGLLLSGGLAQLHALDLHLISSLGMPVSVVDEPETAVIRGIQTALIHLDEFKQSVGYQ